MTFAARSVSILEDEKRDELADCGPAVYREVVEQGHGFPVKEAVETALGDWLSVEAI